METSPFTAKILRLLASRYSLGCTLEELAELAAPDGSGSAFKDSAADAPENQSLLLEALILLDDQGLIFLDSDTDRSVITIKGLLLVHDKVLCN